MIRIVNINPIVKSRVRDMVLTLLPEVGYVNVANSGLVTMKKHWWSIRRVRTTVTDLVVGILPKKISDFAIMTNGHGYSRVFNEHIAVLMSLSGYNTQFDVCSYVWEQYQKYCVEVPTIIVNTNNEMAVLKKKNYLPIPFKVSTGKISTLVEIIQKNKPGRMQRRFIEKLNRMRENLPVPVITFQGLFAFS